MTRIYKSPFATTGDKEDLAISSQPDGKVNLTDGWTSVYELEPDHPSYKPIGRQEMNGILNEVTSAIGELQLQGGIIRWVAIEGGFNKGAVVYGADMQTMWQSTVDANTTDPDSAEASGWRMLSSRSVGEIGTFCFATTPKGWLMADGTAVSRTKYSQLFKVIGTTFGAGDGNATFNLPDLRGEFVRGWASDRADVDAGRVLGSRQEATSVTMEVGNKDGVLGIFSSNSDGTSYGSGYQRYVVTSPQGLGVTWFKVKPRNIALAMFIFAGA